MYSTRSEPDERAELSWANDLARSFGKFQTRGSTRSLPTLDTRRSSMLIFQVISHFISSILRKIFSLDLLFPFIPYLSSYWPKELSLFIREGKFWWNLKVSWIIVNTNPIIISRCGDEAVIWNLKYYYYN